jgi:ABC-2 type transport system ATP-binding protein
LFRTPLEAKRALSFFSDEPRLFEFLSVQQHLEFVARIYQVTDGAERSRQLLEDLELAEVAAQLPAQLSRGMKQKVALACGFLHQPRAMFFDEPLTGLDPMAIRRTKDLIRQQAAAGVAIVISSHLLHLLEEVCSHVLVLKKGRTVSYDTLDRIRQSADGETLSLEEIFIRLVGEDANS